MLQTVTEFCLLQLTPSHAGSQQTHSVNVTFLESCNLVASDLTSQKRFYNVLSNLCLAMSSIKKKKKSSSNVVHVRIKMSGVILFKRHKNC